MNIGTLNKDLVLGFRKQGLTYYEIAEKFVSPNADAKLKSKQIDKLMCMDGGIIDICENPDGNPTDLDGMKNLVSAIIKSAVDDYGEAYTLNMQVLDSQRSIEMQRIEEFFKSDLVKTYLAIMEGEMHEMDANTILSSVRKQAREGRWIRFGTYRFRSKRAAAEFMGRYPKYSKNYYIYKISSRKWALRLAKIPEEV